MKIKEIKPRTFLVDFETRQELLKTFIRFQEYYESPEFKDKIFTVDEYAKWYMKDMKRETFTYYEDWSGCNVPSYVFDFFREGNMNPLSQREQVLLDKLPTDGERYYVIGTFQGGKKGVIDHEICHSLYYSNSQYKDEVDKLMKPFDESGELDEIKDYILKLGYHESVLMDEVQAYISGTPDSLVEKNVNFPLSLVEKLQKVFLEY